MHVIGTRNVHMALPYALNHLKHMGVERGSRNGPVSVFPTPVTTVYQRPTERVIFHPERDANPFFHLFEALWMLAGRDDLAFCTRFVKTFGQFSDDGKTLWGAYGKRWRDWFHPADGESGSADQLARVIENLKANGEDRRQVISMWDGYSDPEKAQAGGKDVPCNTHVYAWRNFEGELNLTVCCRSNDMVWGAYGANAVHFSVLQEYLAAGVGCPVGQLYQVSNNLHAYHKTLGPVSALGDTPPEDDPYSLGQVQPYPMFNTPLDQWMQDLQTFLKYGPCVGLRDPFFRRVATPIWVAHEAFRLHKGEERYELAISTLDQCHATDWRRAGQEWLQRRYDKYLEKRSQAVEQEAED